MRLPIPVMHGSVQVDEVETKEYTAGVIADTKKAVSVNVYKAIQVFLTGCIEKIGSITERSEIRDIVGKMPYRSVEPVLFEILTVDDDGIEGVYPCPRCGKTIIAEKTETEDNRDFISQIPVSYSNGETQVSIELDSPIEIKDASDEEIRDVLTIEMGFPTLNNLVTACGKWPESDSYRIELQAYIEAITKVSGSPVDQKWKNRWGSYVMERLSRTDIKKLQKELTKFGLNPMVAKSCPSCGKKFDVALNTSNFFVSALRE